MYRHIVKENIVRVRYISFVIELYYRTARKLYVKKIVIKKLDKRNVTIKRQFTLYAVSRIQQGRQREPNVKTIRSPLSVNFWRHC